MQLTILRMLSGSSLSAFTTAVQARARQVGPLDGISPVRGQPEPRAGSPQQAPAAPRLEPLLSAPPPDRNLPRGSLLDLSV